MEDGRHTISGAAGNDSAQYGSLRMALHCTPVQCKSCTHREQSSHLTPSFPSKSLHSIGGLVTVAADDLWLLQWKWSLIHIHRTCHTCTQPIPHRHKSHFTFIPPPRTLHQSAHVHTLPSPSLVYPVVDWSAAWSRPCLSMVSAEQLEGVTVLTAEEVKDYTTPCTGSNLSAQT